MPFMNTLLVSLTCIQMLSFFQTNPDFGVLVALVQSTITQLWSFLVFLTLWICSFTVFFRLLGATFDEGTFEADYNPDFGDYPKIPAVVVGLLQNFRNSIGDLATPHYKYWEARYDGGEHLQSQIMILFIWCLWLLEVYLMVIILTNFLIALVGQVYEQIQGNRVLTIYQLRASLNQENCRYEEFIRGQFHRDFMVFANPATASSSGSDEWSGVVKAMKKSLDSSANQLKREIRKNRDEI